MRLPSVAVLLAFVLATLCVGEEKKRKLPKFGQIEIAEASVHRSDGKVTIDGRVRNTGDRAIPALVLLVDFRSPENQVITTKQAPLDEELLEPETEAEFHFEVTDPVRAVSVALHAVDKEKREIAVQKPGPFAIE